MFPVPASMACLMTQACSDCILTLRQLACAHQAGLCTGFWDASLWSHLNRLDSQLAHAAHDGSHRG